MSTRDEVLAANDAFYAAFAAGDLQAMMGVWSRSGDCCCIHPGKEPLLGRPAVMESWRRILAGLGATTSRPRCSDARVHLFGETAFVTCIEWIMPVDSALPTGRLAATNIFVREEGRWRMVHHQAGRAPVSRDDPTVGLGPTKH